MKMRFEFIFSVYTCTSLDRSDSPILIPLHKKEVYFSYKVTQYGRIANWNR